MRKFVSIGTVASLVAAVAMPVLVSAAPQPVKVTPANLHGWQEYPGSGQLTFVSAPNSPLPPVALQFDTPNNADEVQIYRDLTPTAIKKVTTMSYSAKRLAGPAYASPAYVLGIDPGNGSDEIYAWYEPVYNQPSTTNYNNWQTFTLNTSSTKFWSFDMVGSKGGQNGANFFTLNDVQSTYPKAKVVDLTLNVGSGTPGWSVRADNVTFNGTTWDFEQNAKTGNNNGSGNSGGSTTTTTTTNNTTTISNTNNVNASTTTTQSSTGGSVTNKNNTSSTTVSGGNASNSSTSNTSVSITNGMPTFDTTSAQ